MANSSPVVVASDQSAIPVSGTVTANIGTVATLATAAKQDTGNTSVASIDTKTPALGQAIAAASVPVVLPAAQITTLTPPAAITGFATETTLGSVKTAVETIDNFISGSRGLVTEDNSGAIKTSVELIDDTVATTASAIPTKGIAISGTDGTNARIIKTDTSGELQVDVLTMPTTTVQATNLDIRDLSSASDSVAAAQSGTWNITNVSGTVSLPTGAATAAKQPALGTAGTASADVLTVQGIASMTALKVDGSAVTQPVSGTVTANLAAGTNNIGDVDILSIAAGDNNIGNVDVVTLPSIPAGTNNIGDVDVLTINGKAPAFGTGTRSASTQRVTIATDDVVPASQSGTWNIGTVTTLTGITNALPAGTNAIGKLAANSGVDIGDVDVTSIAAGTNTIGGTYCVPNTSGGLSTFNATSSDGATALTSTAQAIKASAGQLFGWYIYNPNASAAFVQLYNTAAASVTVGTTNPLFMITIPAGAAANVFSDIGITFSNAGWSCAATSTAGGSGAPSTALDAVFFYK